MTDSQQPTPIRLGEGAARREHHFDIAPDAPARDAIAAELGILGLRKLRFAGQLVPRGRRDWSLEAALGATVVQECGVTLAPVTTRLDEKVQRRYQAEVEDQDLSGEIEMPEDDTIEPLVPTLDLVEVMTEALALALPPFPRAEGAEQDAQVFTEPGKTPMRDEDARPFANLANLRDSLKKD